MNSSIKNFLSHLLLFTCIEIIFVLIIFREFPQTNLLTLIGLLHTSYRWIVLLAWRLREKYAHLVRQKFLCTYLPVLYHVVIHVYVGVETVHEMTEHTGEHHDEHSMTWLIVGTISAGVLIALGEYWLHRTRHCDTHHHSTHIHCHDEECEDTHAH
jgi:hypothetical protein